MTSFFEKLKKGMGVEEPFVEEFVEELEEFEKKEEVIKKPEKPKVKKTPKKVLTVRPQKTEINNFSEPEKEKNDPISEPVIEPQRKPEKLINPDEEKSEKPKEKWPDFNSEPEGQLAIDVYQTEKDLVIQSAIAGVKSENLDISIEKDIVSIRGAREKPSQEKGDYFTKECFWGPFSKEIILPVEVDPNLAEASMKEGVLVIRIPKILRDKKRKIAVRV